MRYIILGNIQNLWVRALIIADKFVMDLAGSIVKEQHDTV